jgi:hypothetical protein
MSEVEEALGLVGGEGLGLDAEFFCDVMAEPLLDLAHAGARGCPYTLPAPAGKCDGLPSFIIPAEAGIH